MLQEQYYYRDGDLAVRMASWDSGLSARRRTWGRELKAFDLDQIVGRNPYGDPGGLGMMETWNFAVRALAEYKHERGIHVDWGRYEAQWSAYRQLANGIAVPAFSCFYRRADYAMYVVPLNGVAKDMIDERWMSEAEWVWFLYYLRDLEPSKGHLKQFNSTKPTGYRNAA